ncbi:MAG: TIGR03086 family metal-binding protein [Ilumatobacteraceae bacterium]|jgi:uncharacterized protein (TIGR03086 family)|nr:TIGR03086 family metal-binding protein [Ilumatobacteraceae bacterium]
MGDVADRYRTVAAAFTARVDGTTSDGWDRPAPCEGWVARDVVRHLVEWVPGVLEAGAGVQVAAGPSVDDDPAGAWRALDAAIQALLDDPAASARPFDLPPMGAMPLETAIERLVLGDVLVHTWDLARATDQDETLLATEVTSLLAGMAPMGDAMRASGHFGPEVPVPADADDQTRLLAFTGRTP